MSEILRADLLARMERSRQNFESLLDAFDSGTCMQVGVTQQWNMKDLLAHMVAWMDEFLKQAPKLIVPDPLPPSYDNDEFNARAVRELDALGWDGLRDRFRTTLAGVRRHLQAVPAEQLAWGTWYRGFLEGATIVHFYEHASQVSAWRKQLEIPEAE